MTELQIKEGIAYAENAFIGQNSHLNKDKDLFKAQFNLNGKKVLDFGCGMGGMTLWYAQNWNCTIKGIDVDPNHIDIAERLLHKHKVDNVSFELRNVLANPLREKFDLIILNDVAEHIPIELLEKIFLSLRESLLPGGGIFVSYPPWEGPYASHLNHDISLPWCQYLPNDILMKMIKNKDRVLVGSKTLIEEYKKLNHLNHNRLEKITQNTGLKISSRKSHTKLNKLTFLKNKNINSGLFKYLVTKELIYLQQA